jgi:hypothetical protein
VYPSFSGRNLAGADGVKTEMERYLRQSEFRETVEAPISMKKRVILSERNTR